VKRGELQFRVSESNKRVAFVARQTGFELMRAA
jgi:hypothetical protein